MNPDFNSIPPKAKSTFVGNGLIFIFSAPFILSGLLALRKGLTGESKGDALKDIIVGAALAVVGLCVLSGGLWIKNWFKKGDALKQRYPDEPWKWQDDWSNGYSTPNETKQSLFLFGFSLVFILLTTPLAFVALTKNTTDKSWLLYLILLFPVVGLLMLYSSVKQYRRMKIVNAGPLYFNGCGVLGGKFVGLVTVSHRVPESATILLRLNNKHTYSHGNGKDSSQYTKILWQKEIVATIMPNGRRRDISVEFDVPFDTIPTFGENPEFNQAQALSATLQYGLRDSSPRENLDTYHWDLTIQIESSNLNAKLSYDVPVFKTAQSDSSKLQALESQEIQVASEQPKANSMQITKLGEGYDIQFSKNRVAVLSTVFGIFGLVFLAVGIGLGSKLVVSKGFFLLAIPIPIVFSLVGIGLFGLGLLSAFQKVQIIINDSDLIIFKTFLGFKTTTKVPMHNITKVNLNSGMQQGDEVWYDLKVDCGKRFPAAIPAAIYGKNDALWVVHQIEKRSIKKAA